jgi:hypothetical protein
MTLTPRDKRMLQVLAVVAGLALVYFVFTTVLGGDDGGDVAQGPTGTTGGAPAPTSSPSVTESPTPRETLPPVDLAGERDPFSIPPGLATGTPSGSVGPTSPGTTTTPPTGTTTPPTGTTTPPTGTTTPPTSTTTPPATSPPPTPPANEITIGGHEVVLERIVSGKKLEVTVDGELWTVEEGALFAENFRLVSVDAGCARFLFGDQSFTLCEGDRG